MGVVGDVRRALGLPRESWLSLGRAMIELAVARMRLGADHSRHLVNAKATRRVLLPAPLTSEQARLVDQVAFAIPRIAQRVPWRADCLIQALAGERWLRRRGICAQVVIGVKKGGLVPLDAHAWLEAGDRIVTGGDVASFKPLAD